MTEKGLLVSEGYGKGTRYVLPINGIDILKEEPSNVATSALNVATSVKKKMSQEELQELILQNCQEWISLDDLAKLIHRSPIYLRNHAMPILLATNMIQMLYPKTIQSIIAEHKDYDDAKAELKEKGLDSQKRNYVVLNPLEQSPTVCTMPDDFIHYSAYRPTTVREMARLQSFDDSFVFQGKRQTGGNNRQKEIPQYTLVGNAVPPLMARAIANTLLQHIK